jgi:hypothetical protein
MPFIAIAIAISLALGGSAAFATTSTGHAAVESAAHFISEIKADVTGSSDADVSVDAAGGTYLAGSEDADKSDTPDSIESHGALRVRSDADADAKALDDKINAEAGAGVEVNVF